MNYRYRAMTQDGQKLQGIIDANDERQARLRLREEGLFLLDIRPQKSSGVKTRRPRISHSELTLFTRQLATLSAAALPLEESLAVIGQQSSNKRLGDVLNQVRSAILEGHPLSDALQHFPTLFDSLYRTLVKAGEKSGLLAPVLEKLADYNENRQKIRSKLIQSLIYPCMLTTVAIPPENMLCYGVVPHGVAAANPLIQHPEIPSLSLYSADIAFQRYDMLHGIFRKQKTVSKSGKWLARLAVSCLVLAILSFVGSRSIALWHTLKIEDQLQQQQQETWQRYFPQIKRTHNFRFYFKQQLAQQYPEAVPLLYHLQTLLLEHPELQLMEANYSQKQKSLTLKMSAKSEANIDRFCELTQSWLPMEKTEKDPVSGVWTVRNSGK